jgi:FKBP-type peptidyl-prolyl cis-trans isomerase
MSSASAIPYENRWVESGVQITNIFVQHGRKAQRGDRVTIAYKRKLDTNKNHAFDKTSLHNHEEPAKKKKK